MEKEPGLIICWGKIACSLGRGTRGKGSALDGCAHQKDIELLSA